MRSAWWPSATATGATPASASEGTAGSARLANRTPTRGGANTTPHTGKGDKNLPRTSAASAIGSSPKVKWKCVTVSVASGSLNPAKLPL